MIKVTSFILLLFSLLAGTLSPSSNAFAMGAFETSGNVRWLVFASRQNVDEAIGLARRFGSDFGPPAVMSSNNGWYAVVAGPISVPDVEALKKRLADLWWPPKDSFLSKGERLQERVWEAPKSPALASASSDKSPHATSAFGVEVRINAHGIVTVRSGQDVATVRFDDQGPNTSTAAQLARLDVSSPFPQVVVRHFTGGAHCCSVMKVLTFVDGRRETVNVGEFDSDGPQIEDLNGDGAAELVGKAPPKVFRLVGRRIVEVSHSPEFRRPILQMLLAEQGLATPDMWRDNGFLAGWVAHNAIVGNGAEAWRKMLDLHNRNSDWDLSVCTVATKGSDPCPEYAKRPRDFPTALREHLAKDSYSIDGAVVPTAAVNPSFDCNRARTPSEIKICRSPRLAELDNILASGYAFLKTTQGRLAADAIGIPYWKLIGRCEGDEGCILRRQSEENSALALAGAPLSLPSWASAPPQPEERTPPSPPRRPSRPRQQINRRRHPSPMKAAPREPDFLLRQMERSSQTHMSSRVARRFVSLRTPVRAGPCSIRAETWSELCRPS
jgi:hypothetical protein